MEAGKRSINDIFNGNKILEVPFFQRAYVWDTLQWDRFLSDMEYVSQNNKPYFLGSIILKQQLTDSRQSIGDKRTIIDGQQRFTTLSIFFKVLSLKAKNVHLANIFRLPMKNNEIALLHNYNDVSIFNNIMNFDEEKNVTEEDNISRAYSFFLKNMDITKINHQNILSNIMFVGIDLGIDEDEQQIFDTINSLGVKLTTAELLKNYFFGREDIKLFKDHWQIVFEANNEIRDFWDTEIIAGRLRRYLIDLFFYSFLQIKIQDNNLGIVTEDKLEYAKVEGLFDSYKKFINKYNINKSQLIAEIKEYANIFQANFDTEIIDSELPSESGIKRINAIIFGLENTTLIPYVLYILKNVPDVQEQNAIFDYLEAYIMRRMICHENTKNYNQLFGDRFISNQLKTRNELKLYINERSDRINFMPTDSDLYIGFHESRLINQQAAGILYFIESKIRNKSKYATSLLGLGRYSLEHIMPKKWDNKWNNLTNEQDKINRNKKLLTLGNLTIITSSLNKAIKDGSWDEKKNGNEKYSGLRQYATGLDTFSQYLDRPKWDEDEIIKRADFLYNQARKIWIIE